MNVKKKRGEEVSEEKTRLRLGRCMQHKRNEERGEGRLHLHLPKSVGNDPLNLLNDKFILFIKLQLQMDTGKLPRKLLQCKYNTSNCVKFPISVGTKPYKWLFDNCNFFNDVQDMIGSR